MRVLIYPHTMEIGGSQLNAIEMAHGLAQAGHEVTMFGPDGELLSKVSQLGLEYVVAPNQRRWPSVRNMRALRDLIRNRSIDVAHGYEHGPSIELTFGPGILLGTPVVTTVLSMSVPSFIPRHGQLIVGTAELCAAEGDQTRVHLMEPPIDTVANSPEFDSIKARRELGIAADGLVVGIVCRLTTDLGKVDGVYDAISVVDSLAEEREDIQLLVTGGGPNMGDVAQLANAVNSKRGRVVVLVTGGLLDPRQAYASSDIVIGMGSSALKGMSFAKPLVVQGSAGYWKLLDESSAQTFLHQGFFGGAGRGAPDLASELTAIVDNETRRRELGEFGRRIVESRFSLEAAVKHQLEIYRLAVDSKGKNREERRELLRSGTEIAKFKIVRTKHAVDLRVSTLCSQEDKQNNSRNDWDGRAG